MDYIKIEALNTWPRNYRQGDVGAIVTSLQKFGFNGTLRVWKDNMVIAGNHTLLALRECDRLGVKLSGDGVKYENGKLKILALDVTHLDDMQAQAFAIADNRTAALGYNDSMQLVELLKEVGNVDDELLLATGYDGDDLDFLLRESYEQAGKNNEAQVSRELRNINTPVIRVVLEINALADFERAIEMTGEKNRSEAIRIISESYIAKG